jgi:xylulokinase
VAGTPVIVGTVDAASEAISVGILDVGEMMLMYGSTVFTILIVGEQVRDRRLWHAPWLFPSKHACMAGLATSGTLTHWFVDQFARDLDPKTAMARVAADAAMSPPGANGLVALPYFSGERTPLHDTHAKGAVLGLTLAHTRADVYRAIIEGIAFATNHILETYADAAAAPRSIRAVGGGLRNLLWTQTTSDVSARTQEVRKIGIGASYGDAFLAALAVGDVTKDAIEAWNPPVSRIEPDPTTSDTYRLRYAVFREFYPRTRDLMARLER